MFRDIDVFSIVQQHAVKAVAASDNLSADICRFAVIRPYADGNNTGFTGKPNAHIVPPFSCSASVPSGDGQFVIYPLCGEDLVQVDDSVVEGGRAGV